MTQSFMRGTILFFLCLLPLYLSQPSSAGQNNNTSDYKLGIGDKISISVWEKWATHLRRDKLMKSMD